MFYDGTYEELFLGISWDGCRMFWDDWGD